MANQQVREKFQWQRRVRRKNEQKIIATLAKHHQWTWTEIRNETGISPPQLAIHLKRMIEEKKIRQFGKYYVLLSEKLPTIYQFSMRALATISPSVNVGDLNDFFDEFGLAPFNERAEMANAHALLRRHSTLLTFLLMKLTAYAYEEQWDDFKNWSEIPFEEMIPSFLPFLIRDYLDGRSQICTKEGYPLGHYLGDGKGVELGMIPRNEKLIVVGKQLNLRLQHRYKKSRIRFEIKRRRKLRYQYLMEEMRKMISQRDIEALESNLRFSGEMATAVVLDSKGDEKGADEILRRIHGLNHTQARSLSR